MVAGYVVEEFWVAVALKGVDGDELTWVEGCGETAEVDHRSVA